MPVGLSGGGSSDLTLRFLEGEAGGCGAGSEFDSSRLWRLALMRAQRARLVHSAAGQVLDQRFEKFDSVVPDSVLAQLHYSFV